MPNNSWVQQYLRVRRHQDCVESLLGRIESSADARAMLDAFEDFVIHCYSLRDWLIRAGFQEVPEYLSAHEHLRACEGLANSIKHAGLDLDFRKKHPYREPPYRVYSGQDKVVSSTTPPDTLPVLGSGTTGYVITTGGDAKSYDVVPFMSACMAEWDEFLSNRGVLPPVS